MYVNAGLKGNDCRLIHGEVMYGRLAYRLQREA
jgi:hypothetical protein